MRTIQLNAVSISLTLENTRLDHYILLVVDNSIKLLSWHTEKVTNLVRERTEVPDVSHWYNKLDVTRTLTTNLLLCNLYTASVADDSLITDTLVLAAGTLIVLGRTKNALAEETITLRLICSIINGFRLSNLTIRIFQDLLW